jgi:voltage-gated hydrogen channel 1
MVCPQRKSSQHNRIQTSPQVCYCPRKLSPPTHTFSVVLTGEKIAIDAACVLAELIYTFLSESCLPPGEEEGPPWLHILSQISLIITTFFLIEIPITLYAIGPKYCNPFGEHPHASLHLFDWTVILVTFTLEFLLKGREREVAELLIVLRLWRLVKLIGGPSLLIRHSLFCC